MRLRLSFDKVENQSMGAGSGSLIGKADSAGVQIRLQDGGTGGNNVTA